MFWTLELLPGKLNVTSTLLVLIQAIIFITDIEVEPITLIIMLVSVASVMRGEGIVSKLKVDNIRLNVSIALIFTSGFKLVVNMEWLKGRVTALGFSGFKLIS